MWWYAAQCIPYLTMGYLPMLLLGIFTLSEKKLGLPIFFYFTGFVLVMSVVEHKEDR
jgi:hypothetical protein